MIDPASVLIMSDRVRHEPHRSGSEPRWTTLTVPGHGAGRPRQGRGRVSVERTSAATATGSASGDSQ